MDIKEITYKYYSFFCCTNILLVDDLITFVESNERCNKLKGFGVSFSIYIYRSSNKMIITYAPKYHDEMKIIKNKCLIFQNNSINNKLLFDFAYDLLKKSFPKLINKSLLMYVGNIEIDTTNAIKLNRSHYKDYERFFLSVYPNSDIRDGWLKDYFNEKVEANFMFGYFLNDLLVSVCDAPDMPYMENIIQHTGIATLEQYRNKGYAKKVTFLATTELIINRICPQWEADINNIPSINLAKSIGYEEIAQAYILEE